jgi:DNA-binding NarL/FixJ family response regulator
MKRVVVFHRNSLFRSCLAAYLEGSGNFQASVQDHAHVSHGSELASCGADVILLDLNLPGNLAKQIVEEVRASFEHVRVVLLVPDDHESLFDCISAGVHSCVLERSSLHELQSAIESVVSGETFCSVEFAKTLYSEILKFGKTTNWQIPNSVSTRRLTIRERQILELIAQRKCNKEIAKELSVSLFTVKNHVHNILDKLEVESRFEAVEAAQLENLLSR